MHRDDALALACGPLCLQIEPALAPALRGVAISVESTRPTPDDPGPMMTWLARGARFLTLIKTARGTRVYDHADDLLYYAGPDAHLAPSCPEGHAFLCQAVCDRAPGEGKPDVPRLLVTDLVAPHIPCPRQRNQVLRQLAPHLPPICHVQWAGERQALQAFVDSGGVPHDVETLVSLREPLQLVRASGSGIAALDALLC